MLKENSIKSNIKYIIISLLFAILAISTFLLIDYGKSTKKITISSVNNKQFQISEIKIGEKPMTLEKFVTDGVEYNEEYKYLEVTPNTNFAIETSALESISITLIKFQNNGEVKITNDNESKIVDTNSNIIDYELIKNNQTIKEILLTQIKKINIKNLFKYLILFIASFIISFVALKYINSFFNKLKTNKIKIYQLLLFISCFVYFYFCSFYILLEIFNFLILIPEILVIIYLLHKNKESFKKKENIFLIFAIFMGLNFAFLIPPFNILDEQVHYYRAYNIAQTPSEKNKYIENKNSFLATIDLPSNINSTVNFYFENIQSSDKNIMSAKKLLADYSIKIEDFNERTENVGFGATATLNPFCYLFSSLAIKLTRMINGPIILSITLARIFNLIIFIISVFYCIVHIPKFKKPLMVVALLPMTLQQSAAINQDSITNTIVFLTFTYIIKLIYDKGEIKSKDYGIMFLLSILLTCCKLVYFPILFLTFLIPKKRFKSNKIKWLFPIILVGTNILLTTAGVTNITGGENEVAYSDFYTVSLMLHQPFKTIKIFINTAFERMHMDLFNGQFNGFAWYTRWEKNLLAFIMEIIFIILYISNDKEENDYKMSKPLRFTLLLSGFIIICLIYASMLTFYTKADALLIEGLQPRYYIPAILLLISGISNNIFKINLKNQSNLYKAFYLISFAITFYTIISGFYI